MFDCAKYIHRTEVCMLRQTERETGMEKGRKTKKRSNWSKSAYQQLRHEKYITVTTAPNTAAA